MTYTCPVCGFDKLQEIPFDKKNNPSYEICPCCGFEFGFEGDNSKHTFNQYREQWLEEGAKWFREDAKPKDWTLKKQLENLK